jgi:glycosyltransferase involved in cell wall biosynthesis
VNIAYLTPVVYPFVKGGVEKRIYEVGKRLTDRGHDITIYSRHWWDGPETMTHEEMVLRAIGPAGEIYADGDRRSIPSALGLAARSLPAVLRNDHDLFVTPVAPYFHVSTAKLGTLLDRTPLVVTWHEVWSDYWLDYMGQFGRVGDLVERVTAKVPCHPVTPSEMTAERLARIGPSPEEIDVIPNGIDTESIQNVPTATEGYDVLYAGRLVEDKNVDMLLNALNRADSDATLGIIGDGPMRESLEAHASTLDCADRVTFLGFLEEYEDVLSHMRAAPLFVSPSFREGFGITLIEAMASDCTVITVDHPFSAGSEVVGDAGFVTEPTVEEISDALERALNGERPPRDPVEVARAYDWENVADRTESYYSRIVNP